VPDRLFNFAIVLLAAASAASGQVTGYEALSDWGSLPMAKIGITAGLASSYDRTGGNRDYNQYEGSTEMEANEIDPVTVVTLEGPGVITRFWMPHAAANSAFTVKMTIDGQVEINTDSNTLLDEGYGYMQGPLVTTLIGGQVSYEPIAFSQSLKIETNNFEYVSNQYAKRHYYQYSYQKLPVGTDVTAYTGSLSGQQQDVRDDVVQMIGDVGDNPAGLSTSSTTVSRGAQSIDPGTALNLGDLSGSGLIRRMNVKMPGAGDVELDGLRLRVRYDRTAENAIDVPVSHFFGAGHGRVAYKSLPLGTDDPNGFYSYWPMPFRRGVVVELYNDTDAAISIGSAAIEYEAQAVGRAGYLHAILAETVDGNGDPAPTTDPTHELLRVAGRGHYVGNLLWVDRDGGGAGKTSRNILEGDDIITVDVDGPAPTVLWGTGLEDAYNGGFYYNHVLTQSGEEIDPYSGIGPYHGLLRMIFPEDATAYDRTAADQYRWLIGDPVPFTDGIEVRIENYNMTKGASFGSTAFYYLLPAVGDVNGDGNVDTLDITPFVAALMNDEAVFHALYPAWEYAAADCSQDGNVDTLDITPFVSLLSGGGEPVPEPAGVIALAAVVMVVARRRLRPSRSSRRRA